MTLYGVEETYHFGEFKFEVGFDSGFETGLDQRDVWVTGLPVERDENDKSRHLRAFYFDEVNNTHIRAFCKKFAEDAEYREQCLAQTTDWAIRNALFYRNIGMVETPAMQSLHGEQNLWGFLKEHWWEQILDSQNYS